MIRVENISMSYGQDSLFDELSFTLQPGERLAFIGRNGVGKSTLFRLLVGEETPDAGAIMIAKDYRLGLLQQHSRCLCSTLRAEAVQALQNPEEVYKAEKILFGLGFGKEDLEKDPSRFSGGFHLRIHLAKVLIAEPDCLLLDEPTNYLDIVSIRWLIRFLRRWQGESIIISHDREFLDQVSNGTMGLHRNRLVKVNGSSIDFFARILQEEEVHERTRMNYEKKRAHAQSFIDRFGAKATKAAQAQSRQKMLKRIPVLEQLKTLYHLDFSFTQEPFYGKQLGEIKSISFSFGAEEMIRYLSFSIRKGQRIAIIGKNGYGKSTLLRLLARDLSPSQGEIRYSDRVRIGYFGQTNIARLSLHHTVEQEIWQADPQLSYGRVKALCGMMMFSGLRSEKLISVLSGGERSRVLLEKILATSCNLLLLDEPTHHLDVESVEALVDALETFEGAVCLVTHSEWILHRIPFDMLVVCHRDSQEIFLGTYNDFLQNDGWKEEESLSKSGKEKKANAKATSRKQSKALVKELDLLEKKIVAQEEKLSQLQEEIVQLVRGDSQALQKRLKAESFLRRELSNLYDELDRLLKESDL